jgi:16S rRNA C1402 (ribose-2'-O) methylase RsmI
MQTMCEANLLWSFTPWKNPNKTAVKPWMQAACARSNWLLTELPLKTAVKLTSEITGASKNVVYDTALSLKKSTD